MIKLIIMMTLLIASTTLFGQSKSDKLVLKEQAKAEKAAAKKAEQDAEQAKAAMTVDFVHLVKFPNDYADSGKKRIHLVRLGSIEPFHDGDITAYLLEVRSGDESILGLFLPDSVTLVLPELLAKQYIDAVQKQRNSDIYSMNRDIFADVYFEEKKGEIGGRIYFPALVTCIQIYGGFYSKIISTVGNC